MCLCLLCGFFINNNQNERPNTKHQAEYVNRNKQQQHPLYQMISWNVFNAPHISSSFTHMFLFHVSNLAIPITQIRQMIINLIIKYQPLNVYRQFSPNIRVCDFAFHPCSQLLCRLFFSPKYLNIIYFCRDIVNWHGSKEKNSRHDRHFKTLLIRFSVTGFLQVFFFTAINTWKLLLPLSINSCTKIASNNVILYGDKISMLDESIFKMKESMWMSVYIHTYMTDSYIYSYVADNEMSYTYTTLFLISPPPPF